MTTGFLIGSCASSCADVWVEQAARNNAEWCDAVCASHGLAAAFHDRLWACRSRTPPLYPDAVTLDATATAEDVLAHVDTTTSGCSVKDSFVTLDLRPAGFRVLFDATWIALARGRSDERPPAGWSPVVDAGALDRWRRASDCDLRDELVDRDDILILAHHASETEDGIVAGGVLNCSDSVVGMSNLFSRDRDLDEVWSACLAFAGDRFPDLPVVGYEAGATLACARRHGFEAVGQLRVWIDDGEHS